MKRFSRITLLLLALALILPILGGCASGTPALTYGKTSISEGEYTYYVCTYKGNFAQTYSDFDDSAEFYARMTGDVTTAEYMNEAVLRSTSMTLVCEDWFDELGLKLPKETVESIDQHITDMVREFATGSKMSFNKAISNYGISRGMLRKILLRNAKASELYTYLFGSDGQTPVTDEQRNAHYKANYVRIRQIYVNDKFTFNLDDKGEYTYNVAGRIETNDLTEEELADRQAEIAAIDAAFADGQSFDEAYDAYGDKQYPNGYYLSHNIDFVPEVVTAAFDLEVGEWVRVESSIGVHYIERLDLEEEGWKIKANADFFPTYTNTVASALFTELLNEKIGDVVRDEAVIAKHPVETAVPNFRI